MTSNNFTDWRKATYSAGDGNCVEVAAGWRKSSYSMGNGNCVEVAAGWRKSNYSIGNGDCVEIATDRRVVGVRDTTQGGRGPVLRFPAAAWRAFIGGAKSQPTTHFS